VDVNVTDLNYKELPPMQSELQVTSEPDDVMVEPAGPQSGKMVTLEQVFDAFGSCPGLVFNVDLKNGAQSLAETVAKLIFKKGLRERVIWGSGDNAEMTEYLHQRYPDVPQFFTTKTVISTVVYYWLGLLPFITLKESYFQPPHPWGYVLRNHTSLDTTTWTESVKFKVLNYLFMPEAMFKHLKSRGIPTWMWVLNHDKSFQEALENGVDAIMTDYPLRLRQYLDKTQTKQMTRKAKTSCNLQNNSHGLKDTLCARTVHALGSKQL